MKRLTLSLALIAAPLFAQSGAMLDDKLESAATTYRERITAATTELTATRTRIAEEKVPLLNDLRAAEERLLRLRSAQADARIIAGNLAAEIAQREAEAEAQRLNINFFTQAATESLTLWHNATELQANQADAQRVLELRQQLDPALGDPSIEAALESITEVFARVQRGLGGHVRPGQSLDHESHVLVTGDFIHLGPITYFAAADGSTGGTVRVRDEGDTPLMHALPGWSGEQARDLANGASSPVPVDVTGGKALQLNESRGTWIDHVRKGGIVGLVILGIGGFALLVVLLKLMDLRKLAVDSPAHAQPVIDHIAACGQTDTEPMVEKLRSTSRELFAHGLKHLAKPREVIEEHLHAFILRERLQHERWLPMLAVIAAASPLLGLLGTVVGMVKTFTLITVFGTGNAAKLSSGISEALVTTELGLTVAIPALVLHGFLAYRTHKNLSLLERYSAEFIAAAEDYKATAAQA